MRSELQEIIYQRTYIVNKNSSFYYLELKYIPKFVIFTSLPLYKSNFNQNKQITYRFILEKCIKINWITREFEYLIQKNLYS